MFYLRSVVPFALAKNRRFCRSIVLTPAIMDPHEVMAGGNLSIQAENVWPLKPSLTSDSGALRFSRHEHHNVSFASRMARRFVVRHVSSRPELVRFISAYRLNKSCVCNNMLATKTTIKATRTIPTASGKKAASVHLHIRTNITSTLINGAQDAT